MKKTSSFMLMLMGSGFIPLALWIDNLLLKSILLLASIILNIAAVVKSFKEKKNNEL